MGIDLIVNGCRAVPRQHLCYVLRTPQSVQVMDAMPQTMHDYDQIRRSPAVLFKPHSSVGSLRDFIPFGFEHSARSPRMVSSSSMMRMEAMILPQA
jgi:hypothetical protein